MFKILKEDTVYIQDLQGVLNDNFKRKIIKHEIKPLVGFGENFGSEILKVDITVDENGGEKVIHAVGKLIPPTDMQMRICNTQVTFKNEIGFYADIVSALQNFQSEYGIVPFDCFPEMYGARTSLNKNNDVVDTDGVILLENLKVKGYSTVQKHEGFDLDSTKTILRALASFQATALALRRNKPEDFNTKVMPYLNEWIGVDSPPDYSFVLSENPNTASLIPKIRNILAKKRNKKIREPWATITHNDLFANNIMVTESNGAIDSIKFVDFQLIDYGSPLTDVIFFLFSSVQNSVLQYHFEKLLQYYYNEFVNTLRLFKIDTKEFTYKSFQEEAKLESGYQIYHSLNMLFPIFGPKFDPTIIIGKAPEWNPNREISESNRHVGPPSSAIPNKTPPPPAFPISIVMKEKLWLIVEEAAKQKWI